MPKAWSDIEKKRIRQTLKTEGKKLFEQYGIQKTTVDEIVRSARISKGAFYSFYSSKEELYFDILEEMESEFKKNLFENAFRPGESKKEKFKEFLDQFFQTVISTPIYKQITSADYEYLLRKLPSDLIDNHAQSDFANLSRWFQEWMDKGYIKKVDIGALSGLFLSLFFFIIHRDDIQNLSFEATKELWIEVLSSYLVEE